MNFKLKKEKYSPKLIYRIRNQSRFSGIAGVEEDKFSGDELDLYQRIIYKDENLYSIFQTKKSVGEININEFISGSIAYNTNNIKIILGDFVPTAGFGSVFWSAFAPTKGSDVISPTIRLSKGIEPNKSTINFNVFRGIYGEYTLNNLFSDNNANTKIEDINNDILKIRYWSANNSKSATINENNEVTSIAIIPKFRTEREIAKKDNLNEKNQTINLEYQYSNLATVSIEVLGLDAFPNYTIVLYHVQIFRNRGKIYIHRTSDIFSEAIPGNQFISRLVFFIVYRSMSVTRLSIF
jgi:hypothetical protein